MDRPLAFDETIGKRAMDFIFELLKAGLTLAFVFFVLIAIATLFIVIFQFAIDIDNRVTRDQ